LRAGFDGYLAKPIVPETFVAQVDAFLPPGRRAAGPPPPVADPAVPSPAPGSVARRAFILVVDNVPANRSLMRFLLEPFGYEVVAARSGAEALALARQTVPDLILSDLHMP